LVSLGVIKIIVLDGTDCIQMDRAQINTSITPHLQLSRPLHTLMFATQSRLRSFYLPISNNFTAAPSEASLSHPIGLESGE